MQLESVIRETLGIKCHRVVEVRQEDGSIEVMLDIRMKRRLECSRCGELGRVRDRLTKRVWRHVPLWGIPVTLHYRPARVRCEKCQAIRVEAIPWSLGKSTMTKGLMDFLSQLARLLPYQRIAELFQVAWGTVAAAVRQAVAYGLAHRELGMVLYIGIDELSRRKGQVYVTNVYDLKEARLIWTGEGRSRETLKRFFAEYGEKLKGTIEGVCCDMWDPYVTEIKANLPEVTLVFDKFHIIKHLLAAVDQVRREEAAELKKTNPELLKRTRYLWLKNPENLTDKQRARLTNLVKLNLRCYRAYLLKESFREFWTYGTKGWARKFLKKWFWWATHSKLEPMRDFAWMLREHEEEILNYFDLRIDNGAVEGMNNKAKVVSHRCYGFRTANTYMMALYHCLGKLPEPELVHRFL